LIDAADKRRNQATMELSQRLNKIAAEFGLNGANDALLALAACVLLDRNNEVALDGRDLPGTLARMVADPGAVPAWKKYRITADMISSGTVDAGGTLLFPLFTAAALTAIQASVVAPVEVFVQDPEADPQLTGFDTLSVGASHSDGAGGQVSLVFAAGYGDGPEILTDPDYIAEEDTFKLIKEEAVVNATISLPSQDELNPPNLADYQKLIAGAFDIWLLVSKLPA
jgi:hypothetical protein